MPFRTITGDIFEIEAEAIVIPANIKPKDCGGLDTIAYKKAGYDKMLAARQKIGIINPGCCEETPAFGMNGKYVLHTVTPAYMTSDWLKLLEKCYSEAVLLAEDLNVRSIAFPLLGAGKMGIPVHIATGAALAKLNEEAQVSPLDITLVIAPKQEYLYENSYAVFGEEDFDRRYTDEVRERVKYYEYLCSQYQQKMADKSAQEAFMEEQAKYLESNPHLSAQVYRRNKFVGYIKEKVGRGKKYTQQEFANLSFIDIGNLNRILNGGRVKITKETALKAAIALELPINDFKMCIFCSGSSFPCDETDLVIEKCVKKGEYDFFEIQKKINLNASRKQERDK